MEALHFEQYQMYLPLVIGVILMFIHLFYKSKTENLKNAGERCEGIIFKLDHTNDFGSNKDKITVRFVTKKEEWITEEPNTDFMVTYSGQYKEGDKVAVIYNPENPTEFIINTKQSQVIGRVAVFFVGMVFTVIGIYELVKSD